ncbi:probable NAD(P)H dehydrogenase (quinone) FQR1-like 2 [Brassica rapa]|uniref:probable NAD(P)H dehydrogenase (quinone) FQR1-like 2 n=1 Tax=Brassica campestris TaxID=3711 RepID=UPI00142E1F82|nr:probable NAD(P)H dehydrogenase (quinone) FQR1-like 2 [Brassica rapa]
MISDDEGDVYDALSLDSRTRCCPLKGEIFSCQWTAITQLLHHGMLFVPIGYTFGAGMFKMDSVRGGSPYGAGVFAGDGSREATEIELALAEHQGNYMASIVKRLAQP